MPRKIEKFLFELELHVSFHDTHILNITIHYKNIRLLGTNKTSSGVQTKLLSMYILVKLTGLTNATTLIKFSFFTF